MRRRLPRASAKVPLSTCRFTVSGWPRSFSGAMAAGISTRFPGLAVRCVASMIAFGSAPQTFGSPVAEDSRAAKSQA
jgi:hypothetical protein